MIGLTLQHQNVSTTAIYARLNLDPVGDSMQKATTAMLIAGGVLPALEMVPLRRAERKSVLANSVVLKLGA